jgi:enolase
MHDMNNMIASVDGLEILDSRGNPTICVTVALESGIRGTASVPSGASTGENEAEEQRDGDLNRFGGKGVLKAIGRVETEIAHAIVGCDALSQLEIDRILVDLDGTPNKARFGANAIFWPCRWPSLARQRRRPASRFMPTLRTAGPSACRCR